MTIERKNTETLSRAQISDLFDLLVRLDHHRVDLKHAMEKAWDSKDYRDVHDHLRQAQATLGMACGLFDSDKPA